MVTSISWFWACQAAQSPKVMFRGALIVRAVFKRLDCTSWPISLVYVKSITFFASRCLLWRAALFETSIRVHDSLAGLARGAHAAFWFSKRFFFSYTGKLGAVYNAWVLSLVIAYFIGANQWALDLGAQSLVWPYPRWNLFGLVFSSIGNNAFIQY